MQTGCGSRFAGYVDAITPHLSGRMARGVLPLIEQRGPIRALITGDTGWPKPGKHWVGVARPYCGRRSREGYYQNSWTSTDGKFRQGSKIASGGWGHGPQTPFV